jgi:hypothetical protein
MNDNLIFDRFEILKSQNGFMSYDNEKNDYLHDKRGNNCFDDYIKALNLINNFKEA